MAVTLAPDAAVKGMLFWLLGDLNGDGRPDLIVPNYSASTVGVLAGNVDAATAGEDLAALLESRYRLVLPDLRAHGESGVGEGPATMEKHANDIARLLDRVPAGSASMST